MAIVVFRVTKKWWVSPVLFNPTAIYLDGRFFACKNDYVLRVDTSNASEMTFVINTLVSAECCFYSMEEIDTVACYELKEGEKLGLDTPFQLYRPGGVSSFQTLPNGSKSTMRPYTEVQSSFNVTRHYTVGFPHAGTSFGRKPVAIFDAGKYMTRIGGARNRYDVNTAIGMSFCHEKGRKQIQYYRGCVRPNWFFYSRKGSMMLKVQDADLQGRYRGYLRAWKFLYNHLAEFYLDEHDVLRLGYQKCSYPKPYCVTDFAMERKRAASMNSQECHYTTLLNKLVERYYSNVSMMEKDSHTYGCNTCVELPPFAAPRLGLATLRLIRYHLMRSFRSLTYTYPELKRDIVRYDRGDFWDYPFTLAYANGKEAFLNNNYKELIVCDDLYLSRALERLEVFIAYFEGLTMQKEDLMVKGPYRFYGYPNQPTTSETGRWNFPVGNSGPGSPWPPKYPTIGIGGAEPLKNIEISNVGDQTRNPNNNIGNTYGFTSYGKKSFYNVYENDWTKMYNSVGVKWEKEYPGMMESMIRATRIMLYIQENILTSHVDKRFIKGCIAAKNPMYTKTDSQRNLTKPLVGDIFLDKPFDENPYIFYSTAYTPVTISGSPIWCQTWDYDRRPLFHDCAKKKKDDDDDDDDGDEPDDLDPEGPEEEEPEPEEGDEEEPEVFDDGEGENDDDWDTGFDPCTDPPEERYKSGHPLSRMRAFDNSIHPLTKAENNAEQRQLLEQMEENGKKVAHASYDVIAKVTLLTGAGEGMIAAAPESHYLINNTLGLINPCDNIDQLKKDTTEYVIDRATGGAEKFITGGGVAKLRGLKPSGAPTSWTTVEEGGEMYLKPPKSKLVTAITSF